MHVAGAVSSAADALDAAGCETGRLDAEVIVATTLGVDRARLVSEPGLEIPPARARVIGERIRRRIQREPVAYILGTKGFRYIELAVDSRVLIPRPETELLVEIALELPAGAAVHDVGTGSGAIALAVASERPDLRVSASDRSEAAVDVARANAERLGLAVELTVAEGLPPGAYDLVVANLPYVRDAEFSRLAPEITRWEPRDALIAGDDGLDAIRALAAQAPAGQRLALEHAPDQGDAVTALLSAARTHADLAGRPRVTEGLAR
jgi:release factor glutamine methyltransferase